MAMLHIENIDILENTNFLNDISKNDIWYISPALENSRKVAALAMTSGTSTSVHPLI